jgi:urease accessory protein
MIHARPAPLLQRSAGAVAAGFRQRDGVTVLSSLSQAGSARLFLPRTAAEGPEAVILNTSGGLTAGDRFALAFDLGAGARLTAATQTAERAYRAPDAAARVEVTARLAAGARLDWLPQETILYEDSRLDRSTRIDLAGDAVFLGVEMVALGRRAMGETPRRARLADRRHVTRNGRPVWTEVLRLDPATLDGAAGAAGLAGARAFGVVALIGPGAEAAAETVQAIPRPESVTAAASGWDGRCLVRAQAPDLWPLKAYLARVIARLSGRPLPCTWQMTGAAA